VLHGDGAHLAISEAAISEAAISEAAIFSEDPVENAVKDT
jgi:hypothetical protein